MLAAPRRRAGSRGPALLELHAGVPQVGGRVEMEQPGGVLTVEWDGQGDVYLSGPAEFVFEGEWPEG